MNNDQQPILGGQPNQIKKDTRSYLTEPNSDAHRQATQGIIRGELDQIYGQTQRDQLINSSRPEMDTDNTIIISRQPISPETILVTSESPIEIKPKPLEKIEAVGQYDQSYHVDDVRELNQNVDWEKYHKAWQDYYQKYYEYYFQQSAKQAQAELSKYAQATQTKFKTQIEQQDQKVNDLTSRLAQKGNFNPEDEALNDLRSKIRAKMVSSAKQASKSTHFWPIVSAIAVVVVFLFLQYNQIIFGNVMAYVSPGNVNPETIIVDPTTSLEVGPDPLLIIPSINVEVPVHYDIPNDNASTLLAMRTGVAQFAIPGANAHPGEIGNTVISGHATNDVFDNGQYKFIFAQLDKLKKEDIIYANYKGIRYTYEVTKIEIVMPSEVNKLVYPTDKPIMTLITCTPLGTAQKRLLVTAEQIAPDPKEAQRPVDQGQATTPEAVIPGQTKSFLENLFNL